MPEYEVTFCAQQRSRISPYKPRGPLDTTALALYGTTIALALAIPHTAAHTTKISWHSDFATSSATPRFNLANAPVANGPAAFTTDGQPLPALTCTSV